jgi:hypothetical protein
MQNLKEYILQISSIQFYSKEMKRPKGTDQKSVHIPANTPMLLLVTETALGI